MPPPQCSVSIFIFWLMKIISFIRTKRIEEERVCVCVGGEGSSNPKFKNKTKEKLKNKNTNSLKYTGFKNYKSTPRICRVIWCNTWNE